MNTNITKSIVRKHIGRMETEDLISIATLAALEADRSYQAGMNTKPETWQWINVSGIVKNAVKSEMCWKINRTSMIQSGPDDDFEIEIPDTDTGYRGFEFITALPSDCRKIAELVMTDPNEFAGQPKFARGVIVKKLRSEGWAWPRIWSAIDTMKKEVMV